jgi:hypothetical protein
MSMVRRDAEAGDRRRKSRGALTSRPEVGRLLDAASAPASPRELAGEHAAVDAFHRARLVNSIQPGREDMRATKTARTGLKAAIAAAGAVGLLSTGVAFAASGHAPWSGLTEGAAASSHAADPSHPTHPSHPSDDPSDGPESTGPNSHAFGGLCRAYASGNKTEHGKALESPAFAALVTAAGGVDNVASFCSTVPQGPSGTHPAHPTHPAKPTQAASPTHPAHPTHPAKPTEAASPTHPTQAATPTHPAQPTQRVVPTRPSR